MLTHDLLDDETTEKLVRMVLAGLHREYPNCLERGTPSGTKLTSPQDYFPVFYGCYDWHSSVHSHWMLVRMLKAKPNSSWEQEVRDALEQSWGIEKIMQEIDRWTDPALNDYEVPYGMAWFLQLQKELLTFDDFQGHQWFGRLATLERMASDRLLDWVMNLEIPNRTGLHSQTAFALTLFHDFLEAREDEEGLTILAMEFQRLYAAEWSLMDSSSTVFSSVENRFLNEAGPYDFLSPSLALADMMRRSIPSEMFAEWLTRYLTEIPNITAEEIQSQRGSLIQTTLKEDLAVRSHWITPVTCPDPTDGRLAHLDGLNLSRAWMLEGIASSLPLTDLRSAFLLKAAHDHGSAGLCAINPELYSGAHWLGSFAIYWLTKSGCQPETTDETGFLV